MTVIAAIVGCVLLALVLVDAFNAIVLARRAGHSFRITHLYYGLTWGAFAVLGRRIQKPKTREGFLSVYGPLSLIALFGLWTILLMLSFGLLQWAAGMQPANMAPSFSNDLYLSATTLVTLSSGDPQNAASKLLTVFEGALGIGFLGLVVGYLPVMYQSFSNRELTISLMDARAGSPPSAGALLRFGPDSAERFGKQLGKWEIWSADLLESLLSFPMLAYFRSQHSNQSWLTALVAMMDCAAVLRLTADGDLKREAEFMFATGRHVLADTVVVFGLQIQAEEIAAQPRRLSPHDFAKVRRIVSSRSGLLNTEDFSESNLKNCTRLYEPEAVAISRHLLMAVPRWIEDETSLDNWRAGITHREHIPFAVSDPFSEGQDG